MYVCHREFATSLSVLNLFRSFMLLVARKVGLRRRPNYRKAEFPDMCLGGLVPG